MSSSKAFQLVAIAYGLAGMAWGLQMGVSGDHEMMPAHAHLNLLGWVSLSIMAAFYRSAAGRTISARLRAANFALAASAPPVFSVALALKVAGHEEAAPGIVIGSILAVAGLATFGLAVVKTLD